MDTKDLVRLSNEYDKKKGIPSEFICMEECAELIQAISKVVRKKPEVNDIKNSSIYDNLVEEIADVFICIWKLQDLYEIDDEEIIEWVDAKMRRNMNRILDDSTEENNG